MVNIDTTHINESSLGASIIFKSKGALRPSELSLRNVAQTSGLSCLCSHWSSHLGHPSLPALWFQILTFQKLAQNLPPGKLFLMLSYQTLLSVHCTFRWNLTCTPSFTHETNISAALGQSCSRHWEQRRFWPLPFWWGRQQRRKWSNKISDCRCYEENKAL